jgi:hypothetical protein
MAVVTPSRSYLLTIYHYFRYQSILLPCVGFLLISTWIVSPVGEFALNDDWIFAQAVDTLLQTGIYRGHPYLNATFVAQAYWGALFCKVLGFSFTSLRLSTLVLAGITMWGVAHSALALVLQRRLALLSAAVVAVNPVFLTLSYSYMTDIPFLAPLVLAGLCFLRALKPERAIAGQDYYGRAIWGQGNYVLYGNCWAVVAFFVRQFGLILPIALALTLAVLVWRKQYRLTTKTVLGFVLPWLAAIGILLFLKTIQDPGTPVFLPIGHHLHMKVMDGLRHFPVCLCYLGLFCLPLGIARGWQLWRGHDHWSSRHIVAVLAIYSSSLFIFSLPRLLSLIIFHGQSPWLNAYSHRLPLLRGPNMIADLAFGGPVTLPEPDLAPTVHVDDWWWIPTLAALFVASLLWGNAIDQLRRLRAAVPFYPLCRIFQAQELFLLLWAVLFVAVAYNPWRLVVPDRYLLPALVPCVLLLTREMSHYRHQVALRLASLVCGVTLMVALVGQQDYLAFQQATWTAGQRLITTHGASSTQISGNASFNGWYNNDLYMQRYHTRSWWESERSGKGTWALDDTYRITRVPLDGYQEVDRVIYFSWLGMQQRSVLMLKRQE